MYWLRRKKIRHPPVAKESREKVVHVLFDFDPPLDARVLTQGKMEVLCRVDVVCWVWWFPSVIVDRLEYWVSGIDTKERCTKKELSSRNQSEEVQDITSRRSFTIFYDQFEVFWSRMTHLARVNNSNPFLARQRPVTQRMRAPREKESSNRTKSKRIETPNYQNSQTWAASRKTSLKPSPQAQKVTET